MCLLFHTSKVRLKKIVSDANFVLEIKPETRWNSAHTWHEIYNASTDQVKSGGKRRQNFKENKLFRSVHFRKNGNIGYLSLSLQCLELS